MLTMGEGEGYKCDDVAIHLQSVELQMLGGLSKQLEMSARNSGKERYIELPNVFGNWSYKVLQDSRRRLSWVGRKSSQGPANPKTSIDTVKVVSSYLGPLGSLGLPWTFPVFKTKFMKSSQWNTKTKTSFMIIMKIMMSNLLCFDIPVSEAQRDEETWHGQVTWVMKDSVSIYKAGPPKPLFPLLLPWHAVWFVPGELYLLRISMILTATDLAWFELPLI